MDWGGGVTRRVHLQVWKREKKKNWQCLFLWEEGGENKESFLWTLIEKRHSLRFDHLKGGGEYRAWKRRIIIINSILNRQEKNIQINK